MGSRVACVGLPAFPLQLLLRRHADWAAFPSAVVAEDRPQGLVLWVSEKARAAGVLPGQRYAQALSLAPGLRAGVVSKEEIAKEINALTDSLRRFSPDVEPYAHEPGVFWLSGVGLTRVFRSASAWGQAISDSMKEARFVSHTVVGFSRFGSYAVSKLGQPVTVFRDEQAEQRAAESVSLARLDLEPALRDVLTKLGVVTVGGYLKLPRSGLLLRFGHEAFRLHELAAGKAWDPLRPEAVVEPLDARVLFDDPELDSNRLLFRIKAALGQVLTKLAARHQALVSVLLDFKLDRAPAYQELLQPAEATLDERVVLRLVQLRLESTPPPSGVREIHLSAHGVQARAEQLALFLQGPKRDLRAANEALAQLRAEFGNGAVRKAVLRDAHLPEASFSWEPLDTLREVVQPEKHDRTLIRRVFAKPVLLPPPPHRNTHDDGWVITGLSHGAVLRMHGPYVLSGAWWRKEVRRDYSFAETKRGECLWIYYDRERRRWYLQGLVQ